jgi:hypothetical protein
MFNFSLSLDGKLSLGCLKFRVISFNSGVRLWR